MHISKITVATTVRSIYWDITNNYRFNVSEGGSYGNLNGLRDSFLMTKGWFADEPANGHKSPTQLEKIGLDFIKRRAVMVAQLENLTGKEPAIRIPDPSPVYVGGEEHPFVDGKMPIITVEDVSLWYKAKLAAFDFLYGGDVEGELSDDVEYSGISGFRRSLALLEAVAVMFYHGLQDEVLDWTMHIVIPDNGDNVYTESEMRAVQLRENKQDDRRASNVYEDLAIAYDMVRNEGATQADVRKLFSNSRGVMLFYLAVITIYAEVKKLKAEYQLIHQMIKDYKLSKTLTGDQAKEFRPRWDLKKFNQHAVQGSDKYGGTYFGPRCLPEPMFLDAQAKAIANGLADANKNNDWNRPTKTQFMEWADNINEGGSTAPKAMKTSDIKNLGANPSLVVQDVVKLIADPARYDKSVVLSRISRRAEVSNFAMEADDDVYSALVDVVNALSVLDEGIQVDTLKQLLNSIPEPSEELEAELEEAAAE